MNKTVNAIYAILHEDCIAYKALNKGSYLQVPLQKAKEKMNLDLLPEDCFAHILSFTSPSDACRVSLVSLLVRLAADSDNVWEKFLPADYQEILSRLEFPLAYSSKKELFFRLCNPHLIDQGKKTFSLEKSTSKKRYMLSARELSIRWANNPLYWTWKPLLQSRFPEVAELRTISWLEIHGKINTQLISPRTAYGAYLIVKFADRAFGLDSLPSEVSLEVGDFKSRGTVYLRCIQSKKQTTTLTLQRVYFLNRIEALRSRVGEGAEERAPYEREDGWIEIELGSFYNDGSDSKDVKMCLKEVKGEHLKGGLIVEGIELRPKK